VCFHSLLHVANCVATVSNDAGIGVAVAVAMVTFIISQEKRVIGVCDVMHLP